jgi:hypothetical protein
MSDRAPYSRVYWSVMEDAKFDGVREDMRLMGAWMTLLIVADMAWPAPAYPPATVPQKSVAVLTEAGLVDALSGGRFRIHGLDDERGRRRDAARTGGKRDPDGTQTGGKREANGSLAKPSLAETSTRQAEEARDPADIYWSLTGKYPTDKVLSWVDDLTAKYGPEPTIRAILRSEARELDRQERQTEQARLAEKRAQPRIEEPWRLEYRAAIERQYREGAA